MERLNIGDAAAGAVFLAIGALFALGALNLDIGTAFRMGPGYFPLVLAAILMILGLVIIGGSFAGAGEAIGRIPWRGLVLVLAAPVVFGLTVRKLGLAPAIVLTVVISTFASQRANLAMAAIMSICLLVFCIGVFTYGLRLPLPLVGPWLRF